MQEEEALLLRLRIHIWSLMSFINISPRYFFDSLPKPPPAPATACLKTLKNADDTKEKLPLFDRFMLTGSRALNHYD